MGVTAGTRSMLRIACLALILSVPIGAALGDEVQEAVEYPAGFFARYQPNTALDMINQLPGFVLDEGGDARGFAASAGNILINDRRPSAKQDLPSEILARIPAEQVARIELIRAQVRDIDLQGQPVVANVILSEVAGPAVRWRGLYRYNVEFGSTTELALSLSNRRGAIDYNAGIDLRDFTRGDFTPQDIVDGDGDLVQTRFDELDFDGYRGGLNLAATTTHNATRYRLNTQLRAERTEGVRLSERTDPDAPSEPTLEIFPEEGDNVEIELGFDAERSLAPTLLGKAIILHYRIDEEETAAQRSRDANGSLVRERVSDTDTLTAETIGRLEFNWTRWPNHVLQVNVEGAFNALDNEFLQTEDTGDGPVIVDVPGANSRVEEARGDLLVKDTWTRGAWEIELGLGYEVSRIEQTGDTELERRFSYAKPQAAVTHTLPSGSQTRARLARRVSQLDFNDFVSASIFEDNDLALGNPNLRPETTWRAEFGHERRFGRESVVNVTVFHDWVRDVEDLLPLSDEFEAPGNIGDGRRWGIEFEATLPLDAWGLRAAKLDLSGRWQDSTVVDPVTGRDRVFSAGQRQQRLLPLDFEFDNEYVYAVEFRQDLEAARFAWGWDVRSRAERPNFKVNEFVVEDEPNEFNVFVETTRWLGLKVNLAAQNILNIEEKRDRILYEGLRGLTPVARRELRLRERGFRMSLEVSGSF